MGWTPLPYTGRREMRREVPGRDSGRRWSRRSRTASGPIPRATIPLGTAMRRRSPRGRPATRSRGSGSTSSTPAGGTTSERSGSNRRSATKSPAQSRRQNESRRRPSRRSSPTSMRKCRPTSGKRWTPSWRYLGGDSMAKKGSAAPAPPPSSSSGVQRAHELFKQGRAKEALALLRPLLQRKGDVNGDVCALAAACLGAEGDYLEAARIDRLLCEAEPHNPQGWNSLGFDLFNAGDIEGALGAFQRAVKLEPTRASAHYNIARIAARMGDQSKAIEHFARAVELQADYQDRLDEDPDLRPFKDDPEMLGRLPGAATSED